MPRLQCACALALLGSLVDSVRGGRARTLALSAGLAILVPPCYVNTDSTRDPIYFTQIESGYGLHLRFSGCAAAASARASSGLRKGREKRNLGTR